MRLLYVLISFGLIISSTCALAQRNNINDLSITDNKYFQNGSPYSGVAYNCYQSGQLKEEFSLMNGMLNGIYATYKIDDRYDKSKYIDTTLIVKKIILIEEVKLDILKLKKDSIRSLDSIWILEEELFGGKIFKQLESIEVLKRKEKQKKLNEKYLADKLNNKKEGFYNTYADVYKKFQDCTESLATYRFRLKAHNEWLVNEKNKPIYKNILGETFNYERGVQTGTHVVYTKSGDKEIEETLDNGKKNGPYKRYSGNKIVEEGNYVNNEKEGEWTTLNSSEKITQNYSKGKLNGAYKKYNGDDLLESGQFVEGLKNGEWKTFNRLGEIKLIENFSAGKLNGPFNKYNNIEGQAKVVYKNPNDQFNCDESMLNMLKHLMFYVESIANKYLYVDIVKDGIIKIANDGYTQEEKDLINGEIDRWVSFSNISNDKRSSDLNYDYGKSQDWSIRFPGKPLPKISNGLIEKGQYIDGLKNGEWNYFDNEGKLTLIQNYKLDKLDGAFKKYSGDVVIEEGTYSNGLMNGVWKFNYNSGKIKGSGKFLNSDGGDLGETSRIPINGRDGNWILYHENGNKSQECSYVLGKIKGQLIAYHENGKIKQESTYQDGQYNGQSKTFYENGNLRTSGTYINGKIDGNYKWYREDGTLETSGDYRNGIALSQINYDRSGKEIEKEDSYSSNNTRRNSSYTKIMCTGRVTQVSQLNTGYSIEVDIRCPHCRDALGENSLIRSRQNYRFGKQDPNECDEDEFECKECGKISIMKPCLIKHLNRRDKF